MSHAETSHDNKTTQTAAVEEFSEFLRLKVGASHYDFHYFWLFHNCSTLNHPTTGEKVVDVIDIPLDIKPTKVTVSDQTLYLEWPSQKKSEFSIPWLQSNSYSRNRFDVPPPASELSLIEIHYPKLNQQEYSAKILRRLHKYGAVVVRGRGTDTEAIIKELLPEGHDVWASHFGRIEDLRTDNTTNANTDQLGYTNYAISCHTDMPFMEEPPTMQLLHCMNPADEGGESYVVDARSAAMYLKSKNPWAFDMLTTINVTFHRKQKNFEAVTHYPLIQTLGNHITRIRYSYFTLAPFDVPFEWMKLWYQAYCEFASILNDKRFQFRFLLQKGDYVLYSNRTMVHAREGFTGPRWVRGAYFDQDLVLQHLKSTLK